MTIYTHSPTVKVFKDDHYIDRMYDRIYITGEEENVSKAVVEFNKLVISLSFLPLTLSVDRTLHCPKMYFWHQARSIGSLLKNSRR